MPFPPVDWIALNRLALLTPFERAEAVSRCGSPGRAAFEAPVSVLKPRARTDAPTLADRLRRCRAGLRDAAEREWRRGSRLGLELVTPDRPGYPPALRELRDPPIALWIAGRLAPEAARVALVGSRRATAHGTNLAATLARDLAGYGVEIVSGGARGIDTAAHRGTLDAAGTTVAVLGSGLERPYPVENRALYRRIREGGAVVSELPLDAPARPMGFPRRNRAIAALVSTVVVVEAAERSGSLITVRHALELGRDVGAVPGRVGSPQTEGCHALIRDGAALVRRAEDVLETLPERWREGLECTAPATAETDASARPKPLADLTDDERSVAARLTPGETKPLDTLASEVPIGFARLQSALFGLEVKAVIERLAGGYYRLRTGPLEKRWVDHS